MRLHIELAIVLDTRISAHSDFVTYLPAVLTA